MTNAEPKPRSRSAGHAYVLLTLTTLSWGANTVFGRLAVGQVSPMALVALRWRANPPRGRTIYHLLRKAMTMRDEQGREFVGKNVIAEHGGTLFVFANRHQHPAH